MKDYGDKGTSLATQPAQQEPVQPAQQEPIWFWTHPTHGRLYKQPQAQRTWVGLTDEEFKKIKASLSRQEGWDGDGWDWALKEAIEAKLREKNA